MDTRRFKAAFVLFVGAAMLLPASADAGTSVSFAGKVAGTPHILIDGDALDNDVSVEYDAGAGVIIVSAFESLNGQGACTEDPDDDTYVYCPWSSTGDAGYVRAVLRGEADSFAVDDSVDDFPLPVHVEGGYGDDDISGGPKDDILDGGNENPYNEDDWTGDYLYGEGGDDQLFGGRGEDYLDGGEGNDRLVGGDHDDELDGDDGDDVFVADPATDGADDIYDFDGNDTADYSARTTRPVTLANDDECDSGNSTDDSSDWSDGDCISSDIENLIGGAKDDTLLGDGSDNLLRGNGGNDTIEGGPGSDTADYANETSSVSVDLGKTGAQSTGVAGFDSIAGVENVNGGSGPDTLTGNDLPNRLVGGEGNDSLGSRDQVEDEVDCGGGIDTAVTDVLDVVNACENVDDGVPALPAASPINPPPPAAGAPQPIGPPSRNQVAAARGLPAVLSGRSVRLSKRGRVRLSLLCPRRDIDGCRGSVAISYRGKLGRTRFGPIAAGRTRGVSVKLSGRGRRLLKRKRRIKAVVTVRTHSQSAPLKTLEKVTIRR